MFHPRQLFVYRPSSVNDTSCLLTASFQLSSCCKKNQQKKRRKENLISHRFIHCVQFAGFLFPLVNTADPREFISPTHTKFNTAPCCTIKRRVQQVKEKEKKFHQLNLTVQVVEVKRRKLETLEIYKLYSIWSLTVILFFSE